MPRRISALIITTSVLLLAACGGGGGGSTPPPQPVSISISPTSASVPAQGTVQFLATVLNTNNTSVTWKVNGTVGGNGTVGTISTSGLYTAPNLVPNPATVTVTAVAKADTSKSASANATVTVGITVSPSSAELLLAQTQLFSATVTGSNNTTVTWSVNCSTPPGAPGCDTATIGTVTDNGNGTALYTAPNAIPDNVLTDQSAELRQLQPAASTITVVATWQQDPTQTGTASMFVNAGSQSVNQAGQSAPVELGTSGGNATDVTGNFCCSGTLGSLVKRGTANYILSNNHVLAKRDTGHVGDDVSQPGLVDTNCTPGARVADLSQWIILRNPSNCTNNCQTGTADGAIAQIVSGQVDTTGTILQLGAVSGGLAAAAPPANTTLAATVGMPVAKSGRSSGLSCSTISSTNANVGVGYETGCNGGTQFNVNYTNQLVVSSTSFGAPGDSGSLIVNATTAQPVGLLFAGSDTDTIGNPIGTALANLKDSKGNAPTMVGGAQHEAAACTGNIGPLPPKGISAPILDDAEFQRALSAKEAHVKELLSIPAVIGVGVGLGETPGEGAIIVYVEKGKKAGKIPAEIDGVKTRIHETKPFRAFIPTQCPRPEPVPTFAERLGGGLHQIAFPDLTAAADREARLQSRQHAPCVKE